MKEDFYADLTYKYKECSGSQSINQTAIELFSTLSDGSSLYRTITEVNTRLNNCSPPVSKFLTDKFYKKTSCINCSADYQLVKQEIIGGLYSEPESSFKLPTEPVKIGTSAVIGELKNYTTFNKVDYQGKSLISYETSFDGCCSTMIVVKSKTYDSGNALTVEVKDYYSKITSQIGVPFSLIRTVASYNNLKRNEMVIEYSADKKTESP